MDLVSPTTDVLISLLQLSHRVDIHAKELDIFSRAIDTLCLSTRHPSQISTALIDFLEAEIDLAYAIGDLHTGHFIRDVCIKTLEPLWTNLGRWINKGFRAERTDFFITRNEDVDRNESGYHAEGYEVVEGGVPRFLEGIVSELVAAGRAVNVLNTVSPEETDGVAWLSFEEALGERRKTVDLVKSKSSPDEVVRHSLFSLPASSIIATTPLAPVAYDHHYFSQTLVDVVEEICEPIFFRVQGQLYRVFMIDFRFRHHLEAIEGIFLLRNGCEMGAFLTDLFEKVRSSFLVSWL